MGSLSPFDNPVKWTLFSPHDTCSTRLCTPKAVQGPSVPEQFSDGLLNILKFRGRVGLGYGRRWFICFNLRLFLRDGGYCCWFCFVLQCFSFRRPFLLSALSCCFSKPLSLFLIAQTPILQCRQRCSKLHWPEMRPRCCLE